MPIEYALFYEQSPGHDFLYEVYADAVPSRLIVPPTNPWDRSDDGLRRGTQALGAALIEARELDAPLFLITLDPFLMPNYRAMLEQAADLSRRPIAGIIHRDTSWPREDDALVAELGSKIRFCVLAEEMAERLGARGLPTHVLPLHPTIAPVPARPGRQASPDRVTVSLLGELRGGKGLDLVLETLRLLGPHLRRRLHLRFGGRASEASRALVETAVAEGDYSAEIRLRGGADFDVLTSIEFADLVYGTDIGLLLYQDGQRGAVSGVLPNFVAVGAAVIGTRDSVVGSIIDRHGLGLTLDDESPFALHDAIARLVDPGIRAGIVASRAYGDYRRLVSPANVKRTLRGILDLPEILG